MMDENPYEAPKSERTDEERPRWFLPQVWFLVLVTMFSAVVGLLIVQAAVAACGPR